MDRLGRFRHEGYSVWTWWHDKLTGRLLHLKGETMDVYRPPARSTTHSTARWERTLAEQPNENTGKVCSVRETAQEKQVIVLATEPPQPRTTPTTIM